MTTKPPVNMPTLHESNQLRSRDGARRQVARAEPALIALHRAAIANPGSPVRQRYIQALGLRLNYPQASLSELAAKMGMSKARYWRILSRALDCADRLEKLAAALNNVEQVQV